MIAELTNKFPLTEPTISGENKQKEFISLFGAVLKMRNLLSSFDEFQGNEILSERDFRIISADTRIFTMSGKKK